MKCFSTTAHLTQSGWCWFLRRKESEACLWAENSATLSLRAEAGEGFLSRAGSGASLQLSPTISELSLRVSAISVNASSEKLLPPPDFEDLQRDIFI